MRWITTSDLVKESKLTPQAISKVARRALAGKPWNGTLPLVRQVIGRGGQSGLRYEFLLGSLPQHIQGAFSGTSKAVTTPLKTDEHVAKDPRSYPLAKERYAIIEPALAHPAGSEERRAAIAAAVQPKAEKRTIERWIASFEQDGLAGLMRKKNAGAGKARVAVSERFDAALVEAGHDAAILPELADYLDLMIRSLWASQAAYAGDSRIGHYAEERLRGECERRGILLPDAAYAVNTRRVNKWKEYRAVNTKRTDAKRAKDDMATIERDWSGYDARSIIVIDVHHIKVAVTRADGTTAWPKLIGYFDPATQMIFPHLVLCDQGRSISRENVIEGLIRMATMRAWGFPQTVYIDNGSENGALDKLQPALEMLNQHEGRTIIRAIPYNANAKPIEPLFKRLNRFVFSQIKGFGGSSRTKKTQNVGKALIPFQGTWEEFQHQVYTLIAAFHAKPIGGKWGGKSPNQLFQEKIDAGWRAVIADEMSLDAAFCDRVTKRRGRDGIVFNGQRYTHDELMALPKGSDIEFCLPWRAGESPIALIPHVGPVKLLPAYAWPALDKDGPKAAARLRSAQRKALRKMEAETVVVDPVEIAADIVARSSAPIVTGRAHVLDQGTAVQAIADGKGQAAKQHQSDITDAERARARRLALTEAFERNQANAA
ncbi:MAG: hypothetical protein ABIV36_13795 [Sphingobium limneticum]